MKIIGIIANIDKDVGLKYTAILINSILSRNGQVKITSDIAEKLGIYNENLTEEDVFNKSDIIICLGGDGTFLKVARGAFKKGIPLLGINLGTLGFLTELEKNDIDRVIGSILEGNYSIEERMMLESKILRGEEIIVDDMALNDIVISRGSLSRILHLKTYINNIFADSYPGDGVIVSSPTGSTAYSLSAGGPIVEPDIDLMIVTPICPHILYSRSYITGGDRVIKVVIDEDYNHEAMVTVDGQEGYEVRGGDVIEIKKASYSVKMIKITTKNFFDILRKKIHDRGEKLRKNEI